MLFWTVFPILAGVLGVLVMNFILREERLFHLPALHFISRLGFVFGKESGSKVGLRILHFLIGIAFAYLYLALFKTVPGFRNPGVFMIIMMFGFIGIVHGVLSMMFMVVATDERMPIRPEGNFEPAEMISYILAYLGYGATVGLVIGIASKFFS